MQRAFSNLRFKNLMVTYESLLLQLQSRPELPPLFPAKPFDVEVSRLILETDALEADSRSGPGMSTHAPPARTPAARIGLLLLNDDLEAAHPLSQNLDDATGSCWHAIIHRREADFSNSNYWWRLTGLHPAFHAIQRAALDALQSQSDEAARRFASLLQQGKTWQPEAFVACCREVKQHEARQKATNDAWMRQVQLAEMTTLLQWCRTAA